MFVGRVDVSVGSEARAPDETGWSILRHVVFAVPHVDLARYLGGGKKLSGIPIDLRRNAINRATGGERIRRQQVGASDSDDAINLRIQSFAASKRICGHQ